MLKKIIINTKKSYWICLILIIAICYGFTLTNFSMGIDDEAFSGYFSMHGGLLSQGRWAYIFTKIIFDSYMFLPFWRDFIALLMIALGVTILTKVFQKFSEGLFDTTTSIIYAALMLSFPYIASVFIFMMCTIEIGMITILIALSLYCCFTWLIDKKSIKYLFLGIALLAYATGIGETATVLFISEAFMIMFLNLLKSNNKFNMKSLFITIIKIIGIIVTSVILWKIIGVLLQKILAAPDSSYVSNYFGYNFNSFSGFIISARDFIINYAKLLYRNFSSDLGSRVFSFSLILFFILSLLFSIKFKKIEIFFIGLFVILSSISLNIITGNANLPHRTLYTLSIFVGFTFSVLHIFIKDIKFQKKYVRYIFAFLILILFLNQSKELNRLFLADYKSYRHDVDMITHINYDVKKIDDKKPVLFIGIPEEFPEVLDTAVGNTLFRWDRDSALNYELLSHRLYAFAQHHGYNINPPKFYDEDILKEQIKGMNNWPMDNSIKAFPEYVLIKLGETKLESEGAAQ